MSTKDATNSNSSAITGISQANNHLALSLYRLLASDQENVFFSPFSLSSALAMLFCGTGSQTACEMKSTLGYDVAQLTEEDLKSGFQRLFTEFEKNPEAYTLACANSMVSHNNFPIKSGYKSILHESFKALLKEVDFENESAKAVKEINEWIKGKTHDMIPQLLDSLDSSTVMVLLNAVYFKGSWLHQFKECDTFLQYFYNKGLENEYKQVEMMHLNESFPFAEKESFKALQLPYKGEDIAMLILLPHSRNGLAQLESGLTSDFITELKRDMHNMEVEVALPKFHLEYSKAMAEHFQNLGIKRAFSPGADFDPISDSKNLFVSDIIHKAVLEVNEEGSEAAAATAVVMMLCSMPMREEFVVDHPFAFVIYNTKSNLILFMGRIDEL